MLKDPPSEEVVKKLGLVWYSGQPMSPIFCSTSQVWWHPSFDDSKEPVYALFNCGTNWLRILEGIDGEWKEIKVEQIKNLTSFIWLMCLNLERSRDKNE